MMIEVLCKNTRFKREFRAVAGPAWAANIGVDYGEAAERRGPPRCGSAAEAGGDGLRLLQIAMEHRQRVAGIFPQPRVLPGPRFGFEQLDRFLMVLDLVGHELPIEIRSEQRSELAGRRWRPRRNDLQASLEPPKPSIGRAVIGHDAGAKGSHRGGCRPGADELAQLDFAAGAEGGAINKILVASERRRGGGRRRCGGLLLRAGDEGEEGERRHDNRDRQAKHRRPSS